MKNRLFIYILIILVILAIALLLIDIFTGIWYWNRCNLIFNSTEYNNILTPSLTIVATLIYGYALFLSLKQNKIVMSQTIKPHYEREIENYIDEAKKIKITSKTVHSDQDIDITNFMKYINESIYSLARNQEYLEDYDNYNNGKSITSKHVMGRDYIFDLMFLSEFALPLSKVSSFYDKLKELIEEINHSKLILEDKQLLKKRLERTLLSEYLSFIEFEDKHPKIIPPIPLLFSDLGKSEVEFGQIGKTGLRKHYDYFKKEFNR